MQNRVAIIHRFYPMVAASLIILSLAGCGTDYSHITNLDSTGEKLICFGDSNTRGYGASTPINTYPFVLGRLLEQPVFNLGKNGDTTESALKRLDELVIEEGTPRIVIIGLGGNDFLAKRQKELVMRDLEEIVNQIQAMGAMTVIVHAKFGILGSDPYYDGFKDIADRTGSAFVPNILKGIFGNPSRMSDLIHPNDEGNAIMAERVAKVLIPLLKQADAAQQSNAITQ